MTTVDPVTGAPLPPDAIQRILFLASKVHVYNIPPMPSTKGHVAAPWTANNSARQIFTARLRILETALQSPNPATSATTAESVSTAVLLEDPTTAELFAACPVTDASSVEPVIDSARFFALRVVGEGGRKAVLGIGFEERSEAFDFGVSLQEVRKVQGMGGGGSGRGGRDARGGGREGSRGAAQKDSGPTKRDFSLKEGETIRVDLGGKVGRRREEGVQGASVGGGSGVAKSEGSGFGDMAFLPPPPSAQDVRAEMARGREEKAKEAESMGFDDGEFGEFQ